MKSYEEYFNTELPKNYNHIVESMDVEILFEKMEGDYQGDAQYILRNPKGEYGLLTFGYGSCSGCDAFEGCSNLLEYSELRDSLNNQILWYRTATELYEFIRNRDWETQAVYHTYLGKDFVVESLEYIKRHVFTDNFNVKLEEK